MLTRKGLVPEVVWDYAYFLVASVDRFASIEPLAIPRPTIYLLRMQDEEATMHATEVKLNCVLHVPASPGVTFRLLTHWSVTLERAMDDDPEWKRATLPIVPDAAWQKRVEDATRLLRSARTAIQLGIFVTELSERRR